MAGKLLNASSLRVKVTSTDASPFFFQCHSTTSHVQRPVARSAYAGRSDVLVLLEFLQIFHRAIVGGRPGCCAGQGALKPLVSRLAPVEAVIQELLEASDGSRRSHACTMQLDAIKHPKKTHYPSESVPVSHLEIAKRPEAVPSGNDLRSGSLVISRRNCSP
jgi:hypothetical protein